eukprot:GABU01009313.1.p1 GENE.GABU01009313.1~~GABU01009313.1.p1  ORF type:complete len:181 (-),score=55.93 GABU01009313.1:134-676(-)
MPRREKKSSSHLTPRTSFRSCLSRIEKIPSVPEDVSENPVLRMLRVEAAEEALDVLDKIWAANPDKSPFIEEGIPTQILDKINELNRLGPEEAEKSGVNATMVADLAQAIHPMLMEASTAKMAINHGALPILQEAMEIIEESMPKRDFETALPPRGEDISKDIRSHQDLQMPPWSPWLWL